MNAALEALLERAPVGEAGERVLVGERGQPGEQLRALRGVARRLEEILEPVGGGDGRRVAHTAAIGARRGNLNARGTVLSRASRVWVSVPYRQTTRRQALGLGAAAFAACALRSPGAAFARPAVFELDLDGELTASAASAGWRTTRVLRAPRRFDLIGLRWARGSRAEAQVRARRRGGEWTRWAALHPTGDHGPDGGGRRPPAPTPRSWARPTSSSCACAGNPRALRARFVRALPTATVARRVGERLRRRGAARIARRSARAQGSLPSVRVITRSEWGGDSVPPRGPADYGARRGGVRPPHGDRERLRARGLGRDRARHRPLPPRLQRLERPRLQLPRRQVRPGLRGPRRRHRRAP